MTQEEKELLLIQLIMVNGSISSLFNNIKEQNI